MAGAYAMLKRMLLVLVLVGAGAFAGQNVARSFETEAPMERAARLAANGDVFGAQAVLRTAIKAEPRDVPMHMALIRSLLRTGDWLSVEREARTLRALGADRTKVTPMLVRSLAYQKRYADILTELPPVSARPEEQAMNLALRSVAYLGMGDLAQARSAVAAAQRLPGAEFHVRLQAARLALAAKDGPAATGEAEAALALSPKSTEALWTRADAAALTGDTAGAVRWFDAAVAEAPYLQDLRLARAELLMRMGEYAKAQADVTLVLGLAASNPMALFDNALLTMRAGRMDEAEFAFDRLGAAMERFPKAYLYKAQIALGQGHRELALESLVHYRRLAPEDAAGIRLAAQAKLELGLPDEAVLLLHDAPRNDAEAADLEGRAYFTSGRTQDAVGSFERALRLAPDNREIAAHLAAARTRFGDATAD